MLSDALAHLANQRSAPALATMLAAFTDRVLVALAVRRGERSPSLLGSLYEGFTHLRDVLRSQ